MNPKLRAYLSAPEDVREAFDRRVKRAIDREQEIDRWAEQELADDPIAQRVARERRQVAAVLELDPPTQKVDARWDETWGRRARRPKTSKFAVYNRDTDPLFSIDLREAWAELTGEDVPRFGRVRCPNPDHDDRHPDCDVTPEVFNCLVCEAGGSIIDLGAYLYGIEPRGSGFFQIRDRLLATLGMEAA